MFEAASPITGAGAAGPAVTAEPGSTRVADRLRRIIASDAAAAPAAARSAAPAAAGSSACRRLVTEVEPGVWSLDPAAPGVVRVDVVVTGGVPALLSRSQATDGLVQVAAGIARLEALRSELLVRAAGDVADVKAVVLADTRTVTREDGSTLTVETSDALTIRDAITDELAARLRVSPVVMGTQIMRARLLHGPLAATRAALAAGAISPQHAAAIADQAKRMLPDVASIAAGTPDASDPGAVAAAQEADEVFVAKCATLQSRVLAYAGDETPGKTRSRCMRVIASIDAACERERRQRAKAQVGVFARPLDDGLAELVAVLPAVDAASVLAAVDRHTTSHADALACGDPAARFGQLRANALMHLLGLRTIDGIGTSERAVAAAGPDDQSSVSKAVGRGCLVCSAHRSGQPPTGTCTCSADRSGQPTAGTCTCSASRSGQPTAGTCTCSASRSGQPTAATCTCSATRVGVEVGVLIDAATLLGITPDLPAWVRAGSGEPVAIDRDDVLALLNDSGTPTTLRRLICDPATGALVDRGANAYAANDDLAAWLATRDQTCRFPGCSRRTVATRVGGCDVDHAVDFAEGGRTTVANTGMLCRRHHNRKTHAGWRVTDSQADGSCVFISPDGERYHHAPVRLLPEPPEPEPSPPKPRSTLPDDPPF